MKKFLIIFFILLTLGIGYFIITNMINKIPELKVEEEKVNISEYYIYGTTMNMKGTLNIKEEDYKSLDLIFYNGKFISKKINITNTDSGIELSFSDQLNSGMSLEDFQEKGTFYMFIRATYDDTSSDEDVYKYYALDNKTKYKDTTYYTLSQTNKKIIINSNNDYSTMAFNVSDNNDSNVYDIVIDPGHGGRDGGAEANGHKETDFTLPIALKIKKGLEKAGIKVKLTREENTLTKNERLSNYGEHGRAVIPGEVHAKYLISVHVNSNNYSYVNGLEVFTPYNINYDFAQTLANNIVNYTGLNYSSSKISKMFNGVYTRTFTTSEIEDSIKESKEEQREPYVITTNSNYYYMIRETGGYMTGAYVDGRDTDIGKNPYYNSNVGCESYITELGYITNSGDTELLINNEDKYANAIIDAIKTELSVK